MAVNREIKYEIEVVSYVEVTSGIVFGIIDTFKYGGGKINAIKYARECITYGPCKGGITIKDAKDLVEAVIVDNKLDVNTVY